MDRKYTRLYRSFDSPDDNIYTPEETVKEKRDFSKKAHVGLSLLGLLLLAGIVYTHYPDFPLKSINAARYSYQELSKLLETDQVGVVDATISPESFTNHHTDKFRFNETESLFVLRRGWNFILQVTIRSDVIKHKLDSRDQLQVYLTNFYNPTPVNATGKILSKQVMGESESQSITFEIDLFTPHDAGVNVYNLTLCFYELQTEDTNNDYPKLEDLICYRVQRGLVLLFNPYNQKDQVYMADEGAPVLLPEYIENEYGTIWRGSLNDIAPMKWYYAQFDEYVLHSVLYLLQNYTGDTGNAVRISRWMTYSLNAGDTGIPTSFAQSAPTGVLLGRWFGNTSDGTEPEAWMSSNQIFKQYFQTKQTVKYGQCWVYAAIMNTVLRCLGIPARQLVTFNSAHESPRGWGGFYSHVINKYYDAKSGRVLYMDGTIWNFHSWNDAWMQRPDLGHLYDGWQAVDATPQETSRDKYQCGPSPLQAIFEFQDEVEYDSSFIISEVSARVRRFTGTCSGMGFARHCTRDKDLGFAPLYQSNVAALMATPQVGSNGDTLFDVSNLYHTRIPPAPNPNTTLPDNTTIPAAPGLDFSLPDGALPMLLPSFPHLQGQCNVSLRASCDLIGLPIQISSIFSCPNNTLEQFNISYFINGYFTDYTGRNLLHMNAQNGSLLLEEETGYQGSVYHNFTFTDYYQQNPIVQQFSFDIFAHLEETGQLLLATDNIDLQDPPIIITSTSLITVAKETREEDLKSYPITFRFSNSLPIPLTNCQLSIQAVNLGLNRKVNVSEIPSAGEGTVYHKDTFTPTVQSAGKNSILAYLSCTEINGIRGDADVQVIVR